jgi:3-keto-disaccharide hydrolase
MRKVTVAMTVLVAAGLAVADDKATLVKFNKDDLGKVPTGWKSDKTGKGDGSIWKVVADETTPSKTGYALAQTAESPGSMFNLCVADEPSKKDVEVSVAFKAVKGQKDQGGGIVWRYQDANNYYVARMNPLEDNFRLYHVVAGKRTQIGGKEELKVPAGEWHILKIEMEGDKIECYLDGKKEIEVTDKTINKQGKVGLWSKADAQTYFDQFTVSGK